MAINVLAIVVHAGVQVEGGIASGVDALGGDRHLIAAADPAGLDGNVRDYGLRVFVVIAVPSASVSTLMVLGPSALGFFRPALSLKSKV